MRCELAPAENLNMQVAGYVNVGKRAAGTLLGLSALFVFIPKFSIPQACPPSRSRVCL